MNARAILEFTSALTAVCVGRHCDPLTGDECPNCGYRLFCYTSPAGWTEELVYTVVDCLEQGTALHTSKDGQTR